MTNDFYDWKRHPITQVLMEELSHRVATLQAQILDQAAYISHPEVAEKAGAAKALQDVINIEIEGEVSNGS